MQTNKVDINYALKQPPTKAIEYFKSLGMELNDEFVKQALIRAKAKAFTVSSINNAKVVDNLYKEILSNIENGFTPDAFIKRVKPMLVEKGLYGDALPAYRLKQMVRGSMQTAYNAGRYNAQISNISNQPYWMRVEVIDERTRPTHEAVHKVVARADDPYWDNNYPPYLNGKFEHGCRGRVWALSIRRLENMLKSDGEIKVIETGEARELALMDDNAEVAQEGIKSIDNAELREVLRGKLGL